MGCPEALDIVVDPCHVIEDPVSALWPVLSILWPNLQDVEHARVERLSGAMTNIVFLCQWYHCGETQEAIVRVAGSSGDNHGNQHHQPVTESHISSGKCAGKCAGAIDDDGIPAPASTSKTAHIPSPSPLDAPSSSTTVPPLGATAPPPAVSAPSSSTPAPSSLVSAASSPVNAPSPPVNELSVVDRREELAASRAASLCALGARLLLVFGNGRAEERLAGYRTLGRADMREEPVPSAVAAELARFHSCMAKEMMPPSSPPPLQQQLQQGQQEQQLQQQQQRQPAGLWCRIRRWQAAAEAAAAASGDGTLLQHLRTAGLQGRWLRDRLARSFPAWRTYCHNDLQYGNIMMREAGGGAHGQDGARQQEQRSQQGQGQSQQQRGQEQQHHRGQSQPHQEQSQQQHHGLSEQQDLQQQPSPPLLQHPHQQQNGDFNSQPSHQHVHYAPPATIRLIDYDYTSWGSAAFDLANHFCEWAADYHSASPHLLDFNAFPSPQQQRAFAEAYLVEALRLHGVLVVAAGAAGAVCRAAAGGTAADGGVAGASNTAAAAAAAGTATSATAAPVAAAGATAADGTSSSAPAGAGAGGADELAAVAADAAAAAAAGAARHTLPGYLQELRRACCSAAALPADAPLGDASDGVSASGASASETSEAGPSDAEGGAGEQWRRGDDHPGFHAWLRSELQRMQRARRGHAPEGCPQLHHVHVAYPPELEGQDGCDPIGSVSSGQVSALAERLRLCALAHTAVSHLHWGLWGVIQAHASAIDFDFAAYARQRLEQYDAAVAALGGSASMR